MFLKPVFRNNKLNTNHGFGHRFISAALLTSLVFLTACDSTDSSRSKPKTKQHLVETVQVDFNTASIQRTLPGTLQANREVKITTQTQGILKELAVYPGDQVKQGDTLARIDDALIKAEVQKAKASLKQAEIDLKRLKNLAPRKLASESDILQAKTQRDIADSELQLKQTELGYTHIRAPFDGAISERMAEPGDVVQTHQHILGLLDTSSLKAEIHLSELLLSSIETDNRVSIKIDALGDQQFPAKVTRIYPAIDKLTRRGTIEVSLSPVPEGARAGQLCRVTIQTKSKARLMVPYDAVRHDKLGSYVYIVEDGTAKRADILTGIQQANQVEVLGGLTAKQRIVSKGLFGLKNNSKIKDLSQAPTTKNNSNPATN